MRAVVTAAARRLECSRREPYDVPTVYYYGTQDRRDVRINRGTVGVVATHIVNIESVVDQKREALKTFATQKYQGKGYSRPEYLKGIIYKSPDTQALTTVPGLFDPPGFDGTEDCPRQLGHSI